MPSHLSHLSRFSRRRSLARAGSALALALALAGCTAQMAYRDGQSLVAEDKVEAGLLKYQQAIAADPGNARYKSAYLNARDRSTTPQTSGSAAVSPPAKPARCCWRRMPLAVRSRQATVARPGSSRRGGAGSGG